MTAVVQAVMRETGATRAQVLVAMMRWVQRYRPEVGPEAAPLPGRSQPVCYEARNGHKWSPLGRCQRCGTARCEHAVAKGGRAQCALARDKCLYHTTGRA